MFSLENLIYLTIFLLPSYLFKVNFLGLPANVLETLIVIIFVWFLLKRSFKNIPNLRFAVAIGLIFFGLIISTLLNNNYFIGFGIIKGWFIFPLLLAIIAKNIISEEKKQNICKVLYFSALAVAIISLGYYFSGKITFDGRLQGLFNSPNYLAMYLAPAIIIGVLGGEQQATNLFRRIFLGGSFVVILTAFYLTYSYAAWAAIIVSLIIVAGIKNKINLKIVAASLISLCLIVLSQWDSPKYRNIISERSSLQSRIMIWKSAWEIGRDNWIWGIEPGNFQNKYLEYQQYFPPYLEWAVPHPHNLYLTFWLYSGLIGLAGFGALLFLWFKEIWKKERDILWRISLGIMLYFLFHGLIDTTYFKNDLAVIFWLNFLLIL